MPTPKKKEKTWAEKQLATAEKNAAKKASSFAEKKAKRGMEAKMYKNPKDPANRPVSKMRKQKEAALKKSGADGMTGAGVSVGSEKKRITRKVVSVDPVVQAFKRATSKKKKK